MGTLVEQSGARLARLRPRHEVGRGAGNDLVVAHRAVSGSHAVVFWRDGCWWVRDLGSSNGTWLAGRSLGVGEEVRLGPGDPVRFGTEATWRLDDASPPAPWAEGEGGVVDGQGDLLALPDDARPVACVVRSADGWVLETDEGACQVADGDRVQVEDAGWVLRLPDRFARTWSPRQVAPALEEVTLRFVVSHDEEHVQLSAIWPDGTLDLGARVTHYLLLTLARARLADADEPDVAARGWCYRDELCRQLGLEELMLNTHVYRSRRLLAKAGIEGASDLVERRVGTGQLRLGTSDFEIIQSG